MQMNLRDGNPQTVILQHPTRDWLQVVVWEGSLADTLRRHGYTDVIDLADELPDKEKGNEDGHRDKTTTDGS